MKTRIFTLITMVAVLISTTSLTYANTKTNDGAVILTDVSRINQIEARGNVEVYITNGVKDGVKVYDNYYSQNALVQTQNGVLRISSYKTDKLVVLVTVTDLRAVTAFDNATIRSYGTLSSLELDVKLNDNAAAQLKLDVIAANITVNDRAKADLSGTLEDYQLNYSRSSSVNRTGLTAVNHTETIIPQAARVAMHLTEVENIASL